MPLIELSDAVEVVDGYKRRNPDSWSLCNSIRCDIGELPTLSPDEVRGVGNKKILDATCGDRTIWFQKNEPHTIYCDKRREEWEGDFGKTLRADGKKKHRHLIISPDIQCDFTNLPFENESFALVVFDPPHILNLSETSWMRKSYGSLEGDWKPMIHDGFWECMRVLKHDGVLIFKWSDISVSTREIINVIGMEPLFGHRSGKKMNTHWMCFMKLYDDCPSAGRG